MLTAEQVDGFERDGYLVLPSMVSEDDCDRLRARTGEMLDEVEPSDVVPESRAHQTGEHGTDVPKVRPMLLGQPLEVAEPMFRQGGELILDGFERCVLRRRVVPFHQLVRFRSVGVPVMDGVGGGDDHRPSSDDVGEVLEAGQGRRVVTREERIATVHPNLASGTLGGQFE